MKSYLQKLVAKRGNVGARGMTLIEIMVVVFILGLIATVVAINVQDAASNAEAKAAQLDIKAIEQGMDMYRLKKGRYPNTSEGIGVLYSSGTLKGSPKKDPWGKDYVYLYPGQKNPKGFDLISYGPDGNPGGGDDITNAD
ncbi:type II secretion system major pseudopilin GspG [Vulgatibacter sp.]|uniref:type II secretion system major pseudopilin GspG n=1 Tax=Vulgatibacter sp. TaxID=1971226 RepID=UPI00356486C7